jgi:formiminotetrahydrofolate cyclodeaminase
VLDKTATIEQFLEAAAAKQPTPGGGSVAALAGALAAAMGEMVLNYSVGKKGLEQHVEANKSVLRNFQAVRSSMLQWMADDQSAFEKLTAAKKLPVSNPTRDEQIQSANELCIQMPKFILKAAVDTVIYANGCVEQVNPYLLSDLAVCVELAMATVRAAICNVRVNLPSISDPSERKAARDFCDAMYSQSLNMVKQAIPKIWDRIHNVSQP